MEPWECCDDSLGRGKKICQNVGETSSTIHQMHAIKVQGIQGIQEGDGVPVVRKGTTERAEEAHPIVLEANGNDDGVHGDGVQKVPVVMAVACNTEVGNVDVPKSMPVDGQKMIRTIPAVVTKDVTVKTKPYEVVIRAAEGMLTMNCSTSMITKMKYPTVGRVCAMLLNTATMVTTDMIEAVHCTTIMVERSSKTIKRHNRTGNAQKVVDVTDGIITVEEDNEVAEENKNVKPKKN